LASQAPWLFVTWTDPLVLGAGAVGVAALVGLGVLWNRRKASASGLDATPSTGAAGGSTPQPSSPASAGGTGPAAGGPAAGPGSPQGPGAQQGGPGGEGEERDPTPDPPDVSAEDLAQGTGRTLAEMAANEEVDDTELISRFVHDLEGEQLGETMTIDDGEVILKRDDGFYSVPPDAVIEKSDTLLADPNIDWDDARDAGEAWEEANLDRMEYDEEGLPEQ
jgi:hypothetical protein